MIYKQIRNVTVPIAKVVGLCLIGLTPPTYATQYTAVAGSVIVIRSFDDYQITDLANDQVYPILTTDQNRVTPFMGGLALPNSGSEYSCLDPGYIREVDGWKGVEISASGIIGGVTGSITQAVSSVFLVDTSVEEDPSEWQRITFRGGISYNARGYATPIGDATAEAADNLCAGLRMPSIAGFLTYFALPNTKTIEGYLVGNNSGFFSGDVWLYVPKSVDFGTYNLVNFGITQGSSRKASRNGYLPITTAADTVTVIPPPCTIATQTQIVFDTTTEAGRRVSAPITFQCGDLPQGSLTNAYLLVNAVSSTLSATELSLSYNDSTASGGVVRGYSGQNTPLNSCIDTDDSLFFDGSYRTLLGGVVSGAVEKPLVWQLCTTGNEEPGVATGSAILDIGYK